MGLVDTDKIIPKFLISKLKVEEGKLPTFLRLEIPNYILQIPSVFPNYFLHIYQCTKLIEDL